MPLRTWLARNWIVLVLPAGLFLLLRPHHTPAFAHRRARFTLGSVTAQRTREAGRRVVEFAFAVRGVPYTGTAGYAATTGRGVPGPRCLVEYDSLDPQQNVGHFAVPIPDSLRRAPANGWRVPPFPVPAWFPDHGKAAK